MTTPEPNDDEGTAQDHGRVGYGRLGRYSPLILGGLLFIAHRRDLVDPARRRSRLEQRREA